MPTLIDIDHISIGISDDTGFAIDIFAGVTGGGDIVLQGLTSNRRIERTRARAGMLRLLTKNEMDCSEKN